MADPKYLISPVSVTFVDTSKTVSQPKPVTDVDGLPVQLVGGTGTTQNVNIVPATSGGLSMSYAQLANTTNATSVKGSAGQIYTVQAFNNSAVIAYLKFYNSASAPTPGSGTVVWKVLIPANASGTGITFEVPAGLAFSLGIGYTVTTGIADNDTGAVAASAYIVNIGYK